MDEQVSVILNGLRYMWNGKNWFGEHVCTIPAQAVQLQLSRLAFGQTALPGSSEDRSGQVTIEYRHDGYWSEIVDTRVDKYGSLGLGDCVGVPPDIVAGVESSILEGDSEAKMRSSNGLVYRWRYRLD